MTTGETLAQAIDAALADCLIQAHHYAEAKALLRTVDPAKVAQLVGDPHYGALVDLAFAEIALGERNPAEARRLFAKAGPDLKDPQDRFVQDRIKALEDERKTVGEGKSGYIRVGKCGGRIIRK